jgi:hypothetical protein
MFVLHACVCQVLGTMTRSPRVTALAAAALLAVVRAALYDT